MASPRLSAEHFTRENFLSDLQRLAYHGVTAVLSMGADRRESAWPFRDELRANRRRDAALRAQLSGASAAATGAPTSD